MVKKVRGRLKVVVACLLISMMVFSLPASAVDAAIPQGMHHKIVPYCATKKALDIKNGSSQNGANCQIYDQNGSDAQSFNIKPKDDCYIIYNVKSGKVLDVDNGIAENGRNVQQYEYNGTSAQLWWIETNEDGTYTIVSRINGNYVLDISNADNANGTNVQIWERNGTSAQKFFLIPTSR